jgi:hypothetical protein
MDEDDGDGDGDGAGAKASASASASTSAPRPRYIFGTVDGALGVLISLPPPLYRFLATLQLAMNLTLAPAGGLPHGAWRAWHHERRIPSTAPVGGGAVEGARAFIDGDLIELFADLDKGTQARVAAAMVGLRDAGGPVAADVAAAALHPADGAAATAAAAADGDAAAAALVETIAATVEGLARLH